MHLWPRPFHEIMLLVELVVAVTKFGSPVETAAELTITLICQAYPRLCGRTTPASLNRDLAPSTLSRPQGYVDALLHHHLSLLLFRPSEALQARVHQTYRERSNQHPLPTSNGAPTLAMHTTLSRAQNVFGFFTTVAFVVAALIAASDYLAPRTPSAKITVGNVQVYVSPLPILVHSHCHLSRARG